MDNDFLFVTTAPRGRVESSVIRAFYGCIQSTPGAIRVEQLELKTLIPNKTVRAAINRSRVIVVHSPLVSILPIAIASRLAGAEVWALVWDVYPVLIGGKRFDRRAKRRIADIFENAALKLCNRVFVPSSDFLTEPRLANAKVLNLWPRFDEDSFTYRNERKRTGVLTLIFAGQVNATRGIDEALELLRKKSNGNFRLMIASHQALPDDIAEHPNVIALGCVSQSRLKELYEEVDFGLVSLASKFEGPAFPSKSLEYVAQGLPIIYTGPPLRAYLDILRTSGIGLDLQSVDLIDIELAVQQRLDFHEKRNLFMDMACISNEAVGKEFLRLRGSKKSQNPL